MLIVVLIITVTLLYILGILVGSNIEKQRWEDQKLNPEAVQQKTSMPSAMLPERHKYAGHQPTFNDQGEIVWEQKTFPKTPNGKKIDLFA